MKHVDKTLVARTLFETNGQDTLGEKCRLHLVKQVVRTQGNMWPEHSNKHVARKLHKRRGQDTSLHIRPERFIKHVANKLRYRCGHNTLLHM